jgi:hypothetical protein
MTTSSDTLQPGRARIFQGVQIEANGFESPGWSARSARIAGPDVLMNIDECHHSILWEKGKEFLDVI